MIRILIVDDHQLVRNGLKRILAETPGIVVAGESETGREAMDMIINNDYDIILLDISLPDISGIDILTSLQRSGRSSRVIVLSMHPEEQYARHALRLGAGGYLTKKSAPEELIAAIHKVAAGKKYITESLAETLAISVDETYERPLHEKLSAREYQVFLMIAQGKTPKIIAGALHLSVKTVSTYRSRILEKMNMSANADLIYYAVKNHLVG
jgi:two-component system, NarL family, invasion response regulator UvrY